MPQKGLYPNYLSIFPWFLIQAFLVFTTIKLFCNFFNKMSTSFFSGIRQLEKNFCRDLAVLIFTMLLTDIQRSNQKSVLGPRGTFLHLIHKTWKLKYTWVEPDILRMAEVLCWSSRVVFTPLLVRWVYWAIHLITTTRQAEIIVNYRNVLIIDSFTRILK